MMAKFEDLKDKDKVLHEGLWYFDKYLVLLMVVDGWKQVKQVQLNMTSLWVQMHDLPIMARNAYSGKLLGELMGIVEEVHVEKGEIAWGSIYVFEWSWTSPNLFFGVLCFP